MTVEEVLKIILKFFQNIEERMKELSEQQSIYDTKQDEILHYVEIHNLNAAQSCKLIKELKKVRKERRAVKDEIGIITSIKDSFVDKYKNKFIERDVIQALKNLKEVETRQNNPKYEYQYLTEELEIKDGVIGEKK